MILLCCRKKKQEEDTVQIASEHIVMCNPSGAVTDTTVYHNYLYQFQLNSMVFMIMQTAGTPSGACLLLILTIALHNLNWY